MQSTLLIALGIVSFIALIIILLSALNNKERKKELQLQSAAFSHIAIENNIVINRQESFLGRIIGCNADCSAVLFVNFTIQPHETCCFKLKDITGCSVAVTTKNEMEKVNGKQRITDQYTESIDIELIYKKKSENQLKKLCFYKFGTDHQQDVLALKKEVDVWRELINNAIVCEMPV